jgi:nucleoside-diphosphate-sugar epimerase
VDVLLITGASGFIGGWLAAGALQRGYRLRAQYRRCTPPPGLAALAGRGVDLVRADLASPGSARGVVAGATRVVHAAGLVRDWAPEAAYETHNLQATVRLCEAARAAGCREFLFVSSIAVHGFGPHRHSTEDGPYYPPISGYQRSKREAEAGVLAAGSRDFRVTVLRPGNVYGPGDTTTFYRLLRAQEQGIRGTLGGGRRLTCPVYVEDFSRAVFLALENQAIGGEVFNITGGEEVRWAELMDWTARLLGVRPWLELPIAVARPLARLLVGLYRLLGLRGEPPLTPYRVEHVAHDFHFSIEKARRLLGFQPQVGWREGLRRTVEAYLGRPPEPQAAAVRPCG